MKRFTAFILVLVFALCLFGCAATKQDGKAHDNSPIPSDSPSAGTTNVYTYEELSQMPAKELLDLFIQNGLVINDDLKASYTEEELQNLFKEDFHLWHTGISALSHTMYIDLAQQTKAVYDEIAAPEN